MMEIDRITLEPEQKTLLDDLIKAHDSLPRNKRQEFKYSPAFTRKGARPRAFLEKAIDEGGSVSMFGELIKTKDELPRNLDHDMIFHPGLPNGSIDTFQNDIDVLKLNDLIHFKDESLFVITPTGFSYYRSSNSVEITGYINQIIDNYHYQPPPIEIQESLERFRIDHPDPSKTAFVMMRFGQTRAHDEIIAGIKRALDPIGITAVRADDKQYHDDLFPNVLTYIYGSGFGIAVFERIETEEFNPNVALEVGYMFALKKAVCLLKDKTLKTLHADLVGKLYRVFDPLNPIETIPSELSRWLRDKELA
jgi:hypothetical protein